jgi:DNA-binding NtrC family response regulator
MRPKKRKITRRPVEVGSIYWKLAEFERMLVAEALEKAEWNVKEAAYLLKINRTTLVEIRRRLGFPIGKPGCKHVL